jgi:hypothetical protein
LIGVYIGVWELNTVFFGTFLSILQCPMRI